MQKLRSFLKRFRLAILLLFLVGAAIVFFVSKVVNKQNSSSFETYVVKKQDLKEELILSGEVKAEKQVFLKFKTSGKLAWVGVKEGESVKKGQAIAALDRRELEKEFRKYMNYYLKTRWDFEQTKEDYKDFKVWNISEEEKRRIKRIVEKAQFDLNNAVLDVEIRNLAIKDSVITAPFDGIVAKIDVPVAGVFITPATARFEIVDPNSLYFSVSADQTEVIKLSEEMTGEVVLDVMPEKPLQGKIEYISFVPKEDETGSVYEVKVSLKKADLEKLRVGLTGDFKIITGKKRGVLAIPLGYVQEDKRGFFVYKLEEDKRKRQYIKGREFADFFVVSSGLKQGDKVVRIFK